MVQTPALNRAARHAGPIPAAAGIGLRIPHHTRVMEDPNAAAWLEVHPENYMTANGAAEELDRIRRDHTVSLHAVGLSLGSADGVSAKHLARLAGLIDRYAPGLVSDHLSWSGIAGVHLPDLLPLPYTEEALKVVARNLDRVQTSLKRTLLVENPSTYFQIPHAGMSEPQFLAALARRSGCGVLLDINNIYVSARNHGADPFRHLDEYLVRIPADAIEEIHLAGHAVQTLEGGEELRIDDHGSQVCADVWRMYETAISALGARPTLIEWDTGIPALEVLQAEAVEAQDIMDRLNGREGLRHALAV